MADIETPTGRKIDTSCPFSGTCFGNGYCDSTCPPNLLDILRLTAAGEHELEFLPHTDPDVEWACQICPAEALLEGRGNSLRDR